MLKTKNWEIKSKVKVQSEKFKIDDLIGILLDNRGLKTEKEIDEFLKPQLEDVTVDSVGIDKKQLTKTLERIRIAVEKKEKIVIYGDYDVDGITATAILWESLHALGAEVIPYIPHRVDEGYGLSIKGLTNLLEEHSDLSLVITVDNGIVANDAVDFANEKKIDVIITDHHTLGEKIPDAFAIVHTTALCGAGVAWLLSQEITNSKSQIPNNSQIRSPKGTSFSEAANTKYEIPSDHLSLVALATVADLVPLTGANRTLLKFGLQILKKTKRPGLIAMFDLAKIESDKIDVYTIGHGIAPRLNAMGRLESAMDSLRILCTKDSKRAKELAQKLEVTNRDRQILTSSTIEHAKQQVIALSKKTKILIIEHDSYEEGVIGLVAGKLVETFYLPAIVISKKDGVSKASARSISGFNIIEAIRKTSHLLVNAGGHPMAAGFSVETEKIEILKEALTQVADGAIDETMLKRILRIDAEIPLEVISKQLFEEVQKLSPFGMGCPEPVFVSDVEIREVRQIGMDGKHLKMKVSPSSSLRGVEDDEAISSSVILGKQETLTPESDSGQARMTSTLEFDAIAFGMGEYITDLKKGTKAQIAYVIDENTWNGRTNLQLKIKDISC